MYYTDSFLNEDTYVSRGHVWHFVMMWKGSRCLFCCVSEKKTGKIQGEMEAVLGKWFVQELPCLLEKETLELQRELKRFGAWLKKWCGAGKDDKSPILYVAFGDGIYSSEAEETCFCRYNGRRGVILKPANSMRDWKSGFSGISMEMSVEEMANKWKLDMLRAMSRGELKQGYFILWEDEDDF